MFETVLGYFWDWIILAYTYICVIATTPFGWTVIGFVCYTLGASAFLKKVEETASEAGIELADNVIWNLFTSKISTAEAEFGELAESGDLKKLSVLEFITETYAENDVAVTTEEITEKWGKRIDEYAGMMFPHTEATTDESETVLNAEETKTLTGWSTERLNLELQKKGIAKTF